MAYMVKIWAIVRKEIYITYTNRNLVLVIIFTPLALAAIIGMALGGVNRGTLNIPIVVVNLDQTTTDGINFGQVFVSAFVPGATAPLNTATACAAVNPVSTSISLFNLTDAVQMDDADTARRAVDRGDYAAAIIIPSEFSARMGYSPAHPRIEPAAVEVYADSGQANSTQIIHAIVERVTDQINTGSIAIAASISGMQQRFGVQILQAVSQQGFTESFACGFDPAFNLAGVDRQTAAGAPATLDLFVYFACGQAMFWMLFTAFRGVTDILNEQQQGTLPRLTAMAVPPSTFLAGKLIGTVINCLFQLVLLMLAFSLVRSLVNGVLQLIWGSDVVGIAALMVAASLSAAGLGMFLMALARTPEQAAALTGLLTTFLGALGGAFFPVRNVPILEQIAAISPIYWGSDAFYRLATGQGGIVLHVIILLALGTIAFILGLSLFRRRLRT